MIGLWRVNKVVIDPIDLPMQLVQFELPPVLLARLQYLLDRQDGGTPLTQEEQEEATGLVEVSEFLSLLQLRASRSPQ